MPVLTPFPGSPISRIHTRNPFQRHFSYEATASPQLSPRSPYPLTEHDWGQYFDFQGTRIWESIRSAAAADGVQLRSPHQSREAQQRKVWQTIMDRERPASHDALLGEDEAGEPYEDSRVPSSSSNSGSNSQGGSSGNQKGKVSIVCRCP